MEHARHALALAAVSVLALSTACGGSDESPQATKASPATRAAPTKPAHDLRIVAELEQYVTDEWNKAFADPADANYVAGVAVKSVKCVPQTGTTLSVCTITPSKGVAKRFGYIVADDGSSTERAEAPG
jgi:hypothetical protein